MEEQKKLKFSDYSNISLGHENDEFIDEEDLRKILETRKEFLDSVGSFSAADLDKILKYVNLSDLTDVKIESRADLNYVINIMKQENIQKLNIKVDLDKLDSIGEIPRNFEVGVIIPNVKALSNNQLESIRKNINISSIEIPYKTIDNESKEKTRFDMYKIDTYEKIRNELEKITNGININKPDVEKFLDIYRKLGSKINYNFAEYETDSFEYEKNGKTYISFNGDIKSHNLEGGLLENSSVCEGYSKILSEALTMIGIQSEKIIGDSESIYRKNNETHEWNQVCLNGNWYNVDLTWDADKLKDGREPDFCLQSDEEFIEHFPITSNARECLQSFDRNYINKHLGITKQFEIEERNYTVPEIFELVDKLNQTSLNGTRISILHDFESNNYEVMLGNIDNLGNAKWSDSQIIIPKDKIDDFAKKFASKYSVLSDEYSIVKTNENIEFVLNNDTLKILKEQGLDLDKLFESNKEILNNKETSIPLRSNNNTIENKNESKTNFWNKVLNRFKVLRDKFKNRNNKRLPEAKVDRVNNENIMSANVTTTAREEFIKSIRVSPEQMINEQNNKSREDRAHKKEDLENDLEK